MASALLRLFIRALEACRVGGRYRQKTYAMGAPRVNLDKALALAAKLEDDEIARKLSLGK